MIECKEIEDYIRFVKENPNRINNDRKLLIKNIVEPTLCRDDVFFDREMYEKCIKYCESNYYPLFPYQKFVYAFFFMFVEETPLFPTVIILMGRGNGKDGMMMPLCNFFQTPMHGIKNYHIDIIANNEDQSKDSFNVVYEMLETNDKKFKKIFYKSKAKIINYKTHAELRYNTSNAKTKDGKKGGLLLFNELHAYENYDQLNVFTSQLGKIDNPRTIIITTQGYVRDGPLDDYLKACEEILKTGINELGYFPFICRLDDKSEVDEEICWEKANPSMQFRPTLKAQIKKDYLEMKRLPSKRAEFMTKRMNMPDRNDEVTVASWENILRTTYEDIELKTPRPIPDTTGQPAVIGIDFADIRDFASAGVLTKNGDEYVWKQKTWICKNSPFFQSIKFPFKNIGQHGYTDYEIVDSSSLSATAIVEWCIEQMAIYNVQKIIMDTYRFSMFREAFEAYGFEQETKKNPYGMLRMIRNLSSINTIVAPIVEKAFSDHTLNFCQSAMMRWYANNTLVAIDKNGNKSFGKIEPKLRKNDGFMAFTVAMNGEDLLKEVIIYV